MSSSPRLQLKSCTIRIVGESMPFHPRWCIKHDGRYDSWEGQAYG